MNYVSGAIRNQVSPFVANTEITFNSSTAGEFVFENIQNVNFKTTVNGSTVVKFKGATFTGSSTMVNVSSGILLPHNSLF